MSTWYRKGSRLSTEGSFRRPSVQTAQTAALRIGTLQLGMPPSLLLPAGPR